MSERISEDLGLGFNPYESGHLPRRVLCTGLFGCIGSVVNTLTEIFEATVWVPSTVLEEMGGAPANGSSGAQPTTPGGLSPGGNGSGVSPNRSPVQIDLNCTHDIQEVDIFNVQLRLHTLTAWEFLPLPTVSSHPPFSYQFRHFLHSGNPPFQHTSHLSFPDVTLDFVTLTSTLHSSHNRSIGCYTSRTFQ